MTKMEQKVLLVEDEPAIAETIVYALNSDGFSVTVCSTGGAALEKLSAENFQIVILDVGLPDGSGFEFLKSIRKSSNVPVILLTARSAELDRVVGLEIGADDYVTKPFSPRELCARVKTILRRVGSSEPAATQSSNRDYGQFTLDESRLQITFCGTPLDLSRYEFKLLAVLLKRPGRVFSREQLMQLAWEEPEMSLERTIDAHIKAIRAKLRVVDPEQDCIITHRGFGYSLREVSEN